MADQHNNSHKVNYTAIFVALCVCTLLSVLADYSKHGLGVRVMVGLVMGIALVKATFVLLYFMHIKFEGAWKYVLLAPTMVLALTIPLALSPDIGFHYYLIQVPQTLTPLPGGHHADGHAPSHGAGPGHDANHDVPPKPTPASSSQKPH